MTVRGVGIVALRWSVGTVMVLVAMGLGHVPLGRPVDHGALRLALRTAGTRVDVCRERTPAELQQLPPHMRQARVCTGHALAYRLRVDIDEHGVLDRTVHPAGIHADRPVAIDAQVDVAPGRHMVSIEFAPTLPATNAADAATVATALTHAHRYALATTMDIAAGRVALVVLDRGDDQLRWVESARP